MRLNLGCGPTHIAPKPWVNVDSRRERGVDLIADAGRLPLRDRCVSRLYAGHLFEHIPLPALRVFLGELRRVLDETGRLMIVGPDIDRCVQQREPRHILESVIAHGTAPAGHAWTCSERVLVFLLGEMGWEARPLPVEQVRLPDWPNSAWAPWQLAVEAVPCA